MDPITDRAMEDYHRLVRDERALVEEMVATWAERMQAAKLTFGGRLLCPYLRPHFISPAEHERVRVACRGIFRAIEKAEDRLGTQLWDRVGVLPEERELVSIDPGYRRSSPTSRLDSFLTQSAFQFVELNAESPAGIAYFEELTSVFLALPIMKRFQERWSVRRFESRQRLLDTLLSCYREGGGKAPHPTIAIVDYEEVPTRTEHHLFREFFEEKGYPALVCDPRHLTFEGGRLRHAGQAIDIVYKRLLVNELLERKDQLGAFLEAARRQAVTVVNPFRCKPIHKKAIFEVLTDDELQPLFTADEQAAIRAHVPWTRLVREGRSTRFGESIDLPEYVLRHRDRLVMKPNDEYGGKGVFIGWETSESEWEAALAEALRSPYVVQEKVDLQRLSFPSLVDGGLQHRDLVIDLDPFVFNGEIEGFLTRLSGSSLANVTSGGGQVPALLVAPRA